MTRRGLRPRLRILLAAVTSVLLLVVLVAPTARAQDDAPATGATVTINAVDASGYPNVVAEVSVAGDAVAVGDVTVRVDDEAVEAEVVQIGADNGPTAGVMFVLDANASMQAAFDSRTKLEAAQDIVRGFAAELPGEQGLVAVEETESVLSRIGTLGEGNLERRLSLVSAEGEANIWKGVVAAQLELRGRPELAGDVVIITDGPASLDAPEAKTALAFADEFSIGLNVIALQGDTGLADAVTATGGAFVVVDADTLADGLAAFTRDLGQQYRVSFRAPDGANPDVAEFVVGVGDASAQAVVPAGSAVNGSNVTTDIIRVDDGGFLRGGFAKTVGIVLGLVAAALMVYSLGNIFFNADTTLASTLSPYSDEDTEVDEGDGQSALVKKALAMTEDFADRQGILPRIERLLDQAIIPLRPAEAMFLWALLVVFAFIVGSIMGRTIILGLVLALFAAIVPLAAVNRRAGKRRALFAEQLPDTLSLLSGSLRAGYSFMQALETVAQETEEPMGAELRRVATEARLGRQPEEALDDVSDRMESDDFGWAVLAIRIQREVGGNLAELLQTVAETMTARERLRRDIRSLTAEGRISAIILAGLPLVMGLAIYSLNPDYMAVLFDDTRGQVAMLISLVMAMIGFFWMNRIIDIDI